MRIWRTVSAQFGKPSGALGSVAGFVMAHRESNRERNAWAVDLLRVQPGDDVLEIGFGPGLALEMISRSPGIGTVYGIDHSQKMISLARKRNRDAIATGRMKLLLASASPLPGFDTTFDKVLAVNSFQFWNEPAKSLQSIRECMKKGGTLALVHQPRKPGATGRDALEAGNRMSVLMSDAGFERIGLHVREMKPVETVCALGIA